jgi:hypothetical protein
MRKDMVGVHETSRVVWRRWGKKERQVERKEKIRCKKAKRKRKKDWQQWTVEYHHMIPVLFAWA